MNIVSLFSEIFFAATIIGTWHLTIEKQPVGILITIAYAANLGAVGLITGSNEVCWQMAAAVLIGVVAQGVYLFLSKLGYNRT